MSTRTEPGFIEATISSLTKCGVRAPGTSTEPITRSASLTALPTDRLDEYSVPMRPPKASSM